MATTQITGRQIKDGVIDNAKVKAGAAIDTTKLADGANFIQRGGSVPFTTDQSMGNQKLTNLGTPSAGTDAANKTYVDNAVAAAQQLFDHKDSVRAASTANVTISNPGTLTFDGVTLTTGQRLLLKNQTAPAENGIYVVATSSTPMTRATDFDAWTEVPGALVVIEEGTVNADTVYLSTANVGGTLGTTPITWVQYGAVTGLTSSNFVDKETPTGTVNGSNAAFVLANTPTGGSEHVYLNGLLQESGGGNDYTISSATITFVVAPETGDKIRVSYRK